MKISPTRAALALAISAGLITACGGGGGGGGGGAVAPAGTSTAGIITGFGSVFINGIELANGYQELTDHDQQAARFAQDLQLRKSRRKQVLPPDQRLLAALNEGLPDCSGIAIGLDRVLMLLAGAKHIDEVLSFPVQRA
jgi:elongation factor P--beta-lysine ligase